MDARRAPRPARPGVRRRAGSRQPVSDERSLYLHEVIDIVGLGAWPYMHGTWYTMGITGRWSQVVNLWDIPGGWDGWATAVDRLNLQRTANKELEGWWREAFKHRSGGFDRLLLSGPGCPTTDE